MQQTSTQDTLNLPAEEAVDPGTRNAENAFGMALVFSGIRCVFQYVFLPFILPVIGIAGTFSAVLSLGINTMAIAAIIFSVRTFWKVDYKYKWHYLPVAAVALLLLGSFTLLDIAEIAA